MRLYVQILGQVRGFTHMRVYISLRFALAVVLQARIGVRFGIRLAVDDPPSVLSVPSQRVVQSTEVGVSSSLQPCSSQIWSLSGNSVLRFTGSRCRWAQTWSASASPMIGWTLRACRAGHPGSALDYLILPMCMLEFSIGPWTEILVGCWTSC